MAITKWPDLLFQLSFLHVSIEKANIYLKSYNVRTHHYFIYLFFKRRVRFPLFPIIKYVLERLSNLPDVSLPVHDTSRKRFQAISCQTS